ncbi:hypothetical protein SDC9_168121 [bioreactor metagenome]|uniref:Uncharacterized protein n=1 Tax=bioreactor metagenome TaxID=1076179 RepID=A0A645G470_9ZZZZ
MSRQPDPAGHPTLELPVSLEGTQKRAIVHVGNAPVHGYIADAGQFVLNHFDAQVVRRVGRAVVMHAQRHIAVTQLGAVLQREARRNHPCSHCCLIRPLL